MKKTSVKRSTQTKKGQKKLLQKVKTQKTIVHKKKSLKASLVKNGVANRAANLVKKVVQNNIDTSLLKVSPNMQKTLEAIVSKIEKTPARIQDLQALACRVLKHATEINESLKQKITGTVVTNKTKI
jgi:hypothetical protein